MLFRVFFLSLLLLSTFPSAARADDYIPATWKDLVHTLVRFNALNLQDNVILDEYAMITDCDLYKSFYQDDFKWNQVRQAMLQSMQLNVATYPMFYRYDVDLQLDRYDFTDNLYKFRAKATLHNVNAFLIYSVEGTGCGRGDVTTIPRAYRAVLPLPVNIDGLPLSPDDAQAVLKRMDANGNTDRIVYTRVNLRIAYIDQLRKVMDKAGGRGASHYAQSNNTDTHAVRLDARLDSIDFYEDAARKNLIYHYQP